MREGDEGGKEEGGRKRKEDEGKRLGTWSHDV